jgi:hypothetical protein
MSLKRLAALALHNQLALRRYVPLKRQIERIEPRDTIPDGQGRRDPDIWALRSGAPGSDALHETASVRPIEEVVVFGGDPGAGAAATAGGGDG